MKKGMFRPIKERFFVVVKISQRLEILLNLSVKGIKKNHCIKP